MQLETGPRFPGNSLYGASNQPAGEAGGTTTRFVYGMGTKIAIFFGHVPDYVGGYARKIR